MNNYFTLEELIYSSTAEQKGIKNTPDKQQEAHLIEMIEILNNIREAWGSPIRITSGFRSQELNKAVGGQPTSAHLAGYAVDMQPVGRDLNEFYDFLIKYLKDKEFDQLILEHKKWVHLGIKSLFGEQRHQVFKID